MPSRSDLADLAQVQVWVQEYIRSAHRDDEAVDRVVAPSARLTSAERIGIYREMYLVRLVEALETDYPGVRRFLGAEEFARQGSRYVEAHPSRTYTLNRLGDGFPAFLGGGFAGELARLELALSEVFDAEESPVLSAQAIAAVPADAWDEARLRPIAAFRLLASEYPVSAYLAALSDEGLSPGGRRKRSYVVCYRRDYGVRRLDLARPAFELLTALAGGTPIGAAVETLKVPRRKLFEWFREWTAEGLFQAVTF